MGLKRFSDGYPKTWTGTGMSGLPPYAHMAGMLPLLAGAAATAYRSRRRKLGTRKRGSNKPAASSPLTYQNDVRRIYRRRRAPRIVKRRARRFTKRVYRSLKSVYPFSIHRMLLTTTISNPLNALAYSFWPILTGNCTLVNAANVFDRNIHSQLEQLYYANTPVPAASLVNEAKLDINTARARLVIRSLPTNTSITFLTIAYVTCRRDSSLSAPLLFTQGITAKALLPPVTTGLTNIVNSDMQSTVFDSSLFCKHFIVHNTREARMDPGQVLVLDVSHRPNRTISTMDFNTGSITSVPTTACLRGLTKGFFIFHRGTPDANNYALSSNLAFNLEIEYHYRIMQNTLPVAANQTGFNP